MESIAAELAARAGMRMAPDVAIAAVRAMVGDVPDWVLARFMLAARSTGLSLFSGEVYPAHREDGGLDAVVSLDGWVKLVNMHPDFQGVTFTYSPNRTGAVIGAHRPHEWVEAAITKKGVPAPFTAREYFDEVNQHRGVWLSHPIRATRNAALVQAARYAFGLSGVGAAEEVPVTVAAPAAAPVAAPTPAPAPEVQAQAPRRRTTAAPPPAAIKVTAAEVEHLRRVADAVGDPAAVSEALQKIGIADLDGIWWKHQADAACDALLAAIPD